MFFDQFVKKGESQFNLDGHVRRLEGDMLVNFDTPNKGLSYFCIVEGFLQGLFRVHLEFDAHLEPLLLEFFHHIFESGPFFS